MPIGILTVSTFGIVERGWPFDCLFAINRVVSPVRSLWRLMIILFSASMTERIQLCVDESSALRRRSAQGP